MSIYLHIIKTKTYQNDNRLLKWIDSIEKNGCKSSVFILEDANIASKKKVGCVQVITTSLFFRKFFKKGKGFIFKIPELTIKTLRFLKRDSADIIVFHDLQHYLTLLIISIFKPKNKRIIWDLHELFHEPLLKNIITKKCIEFMLSRVDCIVYTNEYRREYVLKHLNYKENKYFILNNYVDDLYLDKGKKTMPKNLKQWLKDEKYIIWLGAGVRVRNFLSFIEAYSKIADTFKLVILGKLDIEAKQLILEKRIEDRIYETFVKPVEMLNYIDHAVFSVVLYKHISPNNYYCEPNRLYQLITRNIPVIVGCNPQMVNLVNEYDSGIILDDDGSDINQLISALNEMMYRYPQIREGLEEKPIAKKLNWGNQFSEIFSILTDL